MNASRSARVVGVERQVGGAGLEHAEQRDDESGRAFGAHGDDPRPGPAPSARSRRRRRSARRVELARRSAVAPSNDTAARVRGARRACAAIRPGSVASASKSAAVVVPARQDAGAFGRRRAGRAAADRRSRVGGDGAQERVRCPASRRDGRLVEQVGVVDEGARQPAVAGVDDVRAPGRTGSPGRRSRTASTVDAACGRSAAAVVLHRERRLEHRRAGHVAGHVELGDQLLERQSPGGRTRPGPSRGPADAARRTSGRRTGRRAWPAMLTNMPISRSNSGRGAPGDG